MNNKNGQKSGLAYPSTPKSTKRNLSSSLLSPHPNYKKSKKFISPNRFTVLASKKDNEIKFDVRGDISDAIIAPMRKAALLCTFFARVTTPKNTKDVQNIKHYSNIANLLTQFD